MLRHLPQNTRSRFPRFQRQAAVGPPRAGPTVTATAATGAGVTDRPPLGVRVGLAGAASPRRGCGVVHLPGGACYCRGRSRDRRAAVAVPAVNVRRARCCPRLGQHRQLSSWCGPPPRRSELSCTPCRPRLWRHHGRQGPHRPVTTPQPRPPPRPRLPLLRRARASWLKCLPGCAFVSSITEAAGGLEDSSGG
jgi:hypothetical protein